MLGAVRNVTPGAAARPLNFGTLLTLGCLIEMKAEGGWWEVELLGASDGPLAYKPPVTEPMVEDSMTTVR